MAKKRSKAKWIILAVIIIVLAIIFYPTVANIYIDIHNSMINRKCVTESDCAIKAVGPGMCHGMSYGCVNKNSVAALPKNEGWLSYIASTRGMGRISCATQTLPPTSCVCQNNICRSRFCDPGNFTDCFISKG